MLSGLQKGYFTIGWWLTSINKLEKWLSGQVCDLHFSRKAIAVCKKEFSHRHVCAIKKAERNVRSNQISFRHLRNLQKMDRATMRK